jgi:NAD dependent epimerase/dehydratase family enzyme
MSWISLDDALGAMLLVLRDESISGAVNLVAPNPLPQRGFAKVLGRVLRRPAIAPLPALAVRAMFGEMGERLLLEGAFVRAGVLERAGFRFEHPSLEQALRLELGQLHEDLGA